MIRPAASSLHSQLKLIIAIRYEALRAVFVEGRSQKEVAEEFGFTYGSMRQLVLEFRQSCDAKDESTESPFFATSTAADSTKTKGQIQP